MSEATTNDTKPGVPADIRGRISGIDIPLQEILALRNLGLTDKSVRREIDDILRDMPPTLEEAGRATATIRTKGYALFVVGEDKSALPWLSKAGRDPLTLHLLGLTQIAVGRFADAAETLGECSKSIPEARTALVEACLRAGDVARATSAMAKLSTAQKSEAEGVYLGGYIQELSGEYDEAYRAYRAALELDPTHCKARFRLAYMMDLDGNEDQAVEEYEALRRQRPTYTNALVNLGVLYEDRGEYTKAVEVYKEILEIYPNHVRARRFLRDAKASLNMYYDEDLERTEDRRAQILRIPISDFELSVRSRNCLAKMQIETLGDLIKRTEAELLSYKNFGETSLQEIKDILAQKGLRLGMGREEQKASVQAAARTLLGIEPERGDVLGKPIDDLELSVRSRNAMSILSAETLGDLARMSEKDLMEVKNFGQTSMNEVKEKLAEFGLSLAED